MARIATAYDIMKTLDDWKAEYMDAYMAMLAAEKEESDLKLKLFEAEGKAVAAKEALAEINYEIRKRI
jgi:hypothetical protein